MRNVKCEWGGCRKNATHVLITNKDANNYQFKFVPIAKAPQQYQTRWCGDHMFYQHGSLIRQGATESAQIPEPGEGKDGDGTS